MKRIKGAVISGKNKGEKIGFPTINVSVAGKGLESGVFSGHVFLDGKKKKCAIFVSEKGDLLEAYILDFSKSIRGQEVEIEIGEKIRDAIKFENDQDLIENIKRDVDVISVIKG
jgi:riboflavin kinase/FMN adenylyltransferase